MRIAKQEFIRGGVQGAPGAASASIPVVGTQAIVDASASFVATAAVPGEGCSPATAAAARVQKALGTAPTITRTMLDASRAYEMSEPLLLLLETDFFEHYRKELLLHEATTRGSAFAAVAMGKFGRRHYADWLMAIERWAISDTASHAELKHADTIHALYTITRALREIAQRWYGYAHLYCEYDMMRGDDACTASERARIEDSGTRLTTENSAFLETIIPRAPALARFFRESLALYYTPLTRHRNALGNRVSGELARNPAAVREFIRHLHHERAFSQDDLYDDAVDMLLGLEVTRIENEIYGGGASALTPRMREEQHDYGGTPYAVISALVAYLDPQAHDVFYDLGSGFGRPTLMAGMLTEARVHGVEMVPARVAKTNEIRDKLGLANVDYRLGFVDDPSVDLSDGTIFFLFNPFTAETLQRVIARLKIAALQKHIRIATYGPCAGAFYREQEWLRCINQIGRAFVFASW